MTATGRTDASSGGAAPRPRPTTDAVRVLVAGIAVSATITLMAGMAAAGRPATAGAPGVVTPPTGLAPSGLPLGPATGPPATTSRAS